MNHTTIIAKLEQNAHANLDSFPFRYGFHSDIDIDIELTNIRKIDDEKIHKPDQRYGVSATFTLPDLRNKDLSKSYRGKFVISKGDNAIITVIREGSLFETEHFLSETLKVLRKDGDLNPQDLIDMYKERIRTHAEVVKHLSNKIGEKKVAEAEKSANRNIERLSKLLQSSRVEINEKNDEIDHLTSVAITAELEKEIAIEKEAEIALENAALKKKLSTSNKLNRNRKENYSKTNWKKESSTSGVYHSSEVIGDFLVVSLYNNEKAEPEYGETFSDLMNRKKEQKTIKSLRKIRCKNTHTGDYQKAVEDVKELIDGDMITYTTRGAGIYGSDWFYKIEKDSQSESKFGVNTERASSQYNSPSSGGLNTNDSLEGSNVPLTDDEKRLGRKFWEEIEGPEFFEDD